MKLANKSVPANSNVVFYDHSWRNILLYIYSWGIIGAFSCHHAVTGELASMCETHAAASRHAAAIVLCHAVRYLVSCHAVVSSHVSCVSSHRSVSFHAVP